jgi:hypothetical protein
MQGELDPRLHGIANQCMHVKFSLAERLLLFHCEHPPPENYVNEAKYICTSRGRQIDQHGDKRFHF